MAVEEYVLEKAFDDAVSPSFDVLERRIIQIPDSNQGSYQSTVNFSLASITNQGNYIDWQNSYVSVPLVLVQKDDVARANANSSTAESSMMASLKNGHHCIFSGMALRLSNVDIITPTQMQNLRVSYEIMSSFTDSDMEQGIQWGLAFEDGSNFMIATEQGSDVATESNSSYGLGVLNNQLAPRDQTVTVSIPATALVNGGVPAMSVTGSAEPPFSLGPSDNTRSNAGRLKRVQAIVDVVSYGANGGLTGANGTWLNRNNALFTSDSIATLKQSFFGLNGLQYRVWYLYARLSFPLLHDYFRQVPLTKNSFYELTLYLHTNVTFTEKQKAGNNALVTSKKVLNGSAPGWAVSTPYGFNPIQLSALERGQGMDSVNDLNTGRTVYLTIGKAHTSVESDIRALSPVGSNGGAHPQSTCLLHMHMLRLSVDKESQYLSNKIRVVRYLDCRAPTSITNIQSQGTVNQIIESALTRVRKIVMFPYFSSQGLRNLSNTGAELATSMPFDALTSPYDGFGNCFLSSPGAFITDYNIQLAGIPFYLNSLKTADEFYFEYSKTTLNGGVAGSLMKGGQIDFLQWCNQHSVIVTDLTNYRNQSDDDIPKSISISFKNVCKVRCSYLIWIYYEREFMVNVESGQIVV